jgi:hypothetical protein
LSVTLEPAPPRRGITHWSTRLLARELGVSRDTVARIWREYGIQPWRAETFKFSTDPQLVAKVHDVVGLYLHPPERAVVLCVDEKSQIQALERTHPVRSVWPGRPERRTHDYTRHGTTTLFAALEVATGRVLDQCRPRHQEFPGVPQAGRARLAGQAPAGPAALHPDLGVVAEPGGGVLLHHRAPGAASRRLHQRHDLIAAITRFCAAWNQHCRPFSWTKPADEILAKLQQDAPATDH